MKYPDVPDESLNVEDIFPDRFREDPICSQSPEVVFLRFNNEWETGLNLDGKSVTIPLIVSAIGVVGSVSIVNNGYATVPSLAETATVATDSVTYTPTECVYGTPHGGYLITTPTGQVFSFGTATTHGTLAGLALNQPIVALASTADGGGYWQGASDGGVFAFGDAAFYGSRGGAHLNQPIVGMAATPDGRGYWMVASDGGIFSYGDAAFYGSHGGAHLNQPIVGMAATPDGHGYTMVASDGGTFAYGDATFQGSLAGGLRGSSIATVAPLPATAIPSAPSVIHTIPVNDVNNNYFYYAGAQQYLTASGASAQICQSAPFIPGAVHSLTEIDVSDESSRQIVELAWEVDHAHPQPYLQATWWLDGQPEESAGFVQVSRSILNGMALPVGSTASYAIEQADGRWNLWYDGQLMGYFPDTLWNGSFTSAGEVQVFGEVDAGGYPQPVGQMGNGAYGDNLASETVNGYQTFNNALPAKFNEYETAGAPPYFDIGSPTATSFRFGGPGAPTA